MTTHQGPRAGTRAYLALERLYHAGGTATRLSWFHQARWEGTLGSFDDALSGLVRQGMVRLNADEYIITRSGLDWLGEALEAEPAVALKVAGPRYVPPARTLVAQRARPIRAGALDYRDIPSRYGNERHAYRAANAVAGDAQA